MSFEDWMKLVDIELVKLCFLTHVDLPDVSYYDWYESGVTPRKAARRAVDYIMS